MTYWRGLQSECGGCGDQTQDGFRRLTYDLTLVNGIGHSMTVFH